MNSTLPEPTLARSLGRGGLGFALVSVAAFSVWAFAGKGFKGRGGDPAMYAAIAAVFIALSGLLLHPIVRGPRRVLRFYTVFVPAFLAYAAAWCAAWFKLKFGLGEWLGSLAGSAAFAIVTGLLLGNGRAIVKVAIVLFAAHSAGYFLGGQLYYGIKAQHHTLAMLGWGAVYGLCFGAGIGFAFFTYQRARKDPPSGQSNPA